MCISNWCLVESQGSITCCCLLGIYCRLYSWFNTQTHICGGFVKDGTVFEVKRVVRNNYVFDDQEWVLWSLRESEMLLIWWTQCLYMCKSVPCSTVYVVTQVATFSFNHYTPQALHLQVHLFTFIDSFMHSFNKPSRVFDAHLSMFLLCSSLLRY